MWIENAFLAAESIRTLSVSEHVSVGGRGERVEGEEEEKTLHLYSHRNPDASI